jgi:hypothetical protein
MHFPNRVVGLTKIGVGPGYCPIQEIFSIPAAITNKAIASTANALSSAEIEGEGNRR